MVDFTPQPACLAQHSQIVPHLMRVIDAREDIKNLGFQRLKFRP
jgi:hypothetical protein